MAPAAATADAVPSTDSAPQFVGQLVPIDLLFPSPMNPRKKFTEASLVDLTANIKQLGEVIVPLVLRSKGKKFEIIDGERRYRASSAAGNITHLPAIVRDEMTDSAAIEMMLLTSIQKQELTPLEEASGFRALIDSNKSIYSAGYIADRIGRSEKYVWDRMKLLDLIPVIKKLLDNDRILVGHGELLAKLKPEDQERALDWTQGHRVGREGLWQNEHNLLEFDEDTDRERNPSAANLYYGLKPVTVKELESWIAHHVRFDVEHMAKSAPLEFGQIAKDVEHAAALPGRGKKVIAITDAYRVDDDAKDPNERTYGSQSWERADGKEKSKTCEHSVLGVFVAGRQQGKTLQVCINRDKCVVHFGKVIKEREKNQKLRQQGKGGQAAQNETVLKAAERTKAAQAEREREERCKRLGMVARRAIVQIVSSLKKLDGPVLQLLAKQSATRAEDCDQDLVDAVAKDLGFASKLFEWSAKDADFAKLKADDLVRLMVAGQLLGECGLSEYDSDLNKSFTSICQRLGVDVKTITVAIDKEQATADGKTVAKPAKAAKKAKKR